MTHRNNEEVLRVLYAALVSGAYYHPHNNFRPYIWLNTGHSAMRDKYKLLIKIERNLNTVIRHHV